MIRPMTLKHPASRTLGLCFLGLFGVLAGCTETPSNEPMALLFSENFEGDLAQWTVEQQPGGTVKIEDGQLVISDEGGCSVWFRQPLEAPVVIRYTVTASSEARVSDINCFWMAREPDGDADFFSPDHGRTGAFATYDTMHTYYTGFGGNYNGTTRFRRYTGDGKRPLLPEHDLSDPKDMIVPDHTYTIHLVAAGGRAQYFRDGELVFDYADDEPLTQGYFAFRTVLSRLVIDDFRVWSVDDVESVLQGNLP